MPQFTLDTSFTCPQYVNFLHLCMHKPVHQILALAIARLHCNLPCVSLLHKLVHAYYKLSQYIPSYCSDLLLINNYLATTVVLVL